MAVISISLPDPLLEQAEAFIARQGYAGRSELARAALRDFLMAHDENAGSSRRTATLTLVYAHGHERAFSAIRHAHLDVVRTALHSHSGDQCVELFVLEGEASRIRSFSHAVRAAREALRTSLVYTDVVPSESSQGHAHDHAHDHAH